MKLGDLIVFMPGAIMATIAKTIRTNIPEETKEFISKEHLYHCTKNKETAEKIIESRIFKASNRTI
ncbi:MAG: hypothetical protein HFJ17_02230 [Clostridia bacterium]|nr:hypothetical protein [Clostridia bacterium]